MDADDEAELEEYLMAWVDDDMGPDEVAKIEADWRVCSAGNNSTQLNSGPKVS